MLVPIRCFNCNKVLAHLWEDFINRIQEGVNEDELKKESQFLIIKEDNLKTLECKVLDELGITKDCCRINMLSTVDLTETLTKTNYSVYNNF